MICSSLCVSSLPFVYIKKRGIEIERKPEGETEREKEREEDYAWRHPVSSPLRPNEIIHLNPRIKVGSADMKAGFPYIAIARHGTGSANIVGWLMSSINPVIKITSSARPLPNPSHSDSFSTNRKKIQICTQSVIRASIENDM